MSEKAYNRSLNAMQNGLGIKNKLDIRELGIQFGCIRLIPLVQKGLSLYRDRFLAALPASRRASADFIRPVFTAVAFYLCAKRHKVEKIKLIELSGASESEFSCVSASMKDLYYDKFGISKEKKDSKNVKGNRDLLDELPEKQRIEERGYLSDDGDEKSACYCSFYYCICLVMAFYFTYWCKFALVCIWFGLLVLGWAAVAKGCCCSCWP